MKKVCSIFILFITTVMYSNPHLPTFTINEFGFNDKGWVIELMSDYYSDKVRLISNTDTSNFFQVQMGYDSPLYVIINDSLKNSFYINPLGDQICICDSFGRYSVNFSFGPEGEGWQNIAPKKNQSLSLWRKPLGKSFYYLDNSPTFGLPNDSLDAMGTVTGIIKDSVGHPIPNLKVYYDYETFYGGGDIYVTTNDSGFFTINHFAEYITLKFKRRYFYDERVNVQIYPDSTINLSLVIKTDILSDVEENVETNDFYLEQNFPNPFNPVTKIRYSISTLETDQSKSLHNKIVLKVYDVLGNEVATLVNEGQSPGNYEVEFDASKYNLSSGFYFYVLKLNEIRISKKMCLLK